MIVKKVKVTQLGPEPDFEPTFLEFYKSVVVATQQPFGLFIYFLLTFSLITAVTAD